MTTASTNSILEHHWVLDSGASPHMTPYHTDCFNIKKTYASIKLADGTYTTCTHQGEATINFINDLGIQRLLHLQKSLLCLTWTKRSSVLHNFPPYIETKSLLASMEFCCNFLLEPLSLYLPQTWYILHA